MIAYSWLKFDNKVSIWTRAWTEINNTNQHHEHCLVLRASETGISIWLTWKWNKHDNEHRFINKIAMEMEKEKLPSGSLVHCLLIVERIEGKGVALVLQEPHFKNLMRSEIWLVTLPLLCSKIPMASLMFRVFFALNIVGQTFFNGLRNNCLSMSKMMQGEVY